MADSSLPTWPEIEAHAVRHLQAARVELADARDWLNSDTGRPLSDAEANARYEVLRAIGEIKDAIDRAKGMLHG